MTLDSDLASAFARVALANVTREYPHKLDHLLTAPPGDLTPRSVHLAFYGSYDWPTRVLRATPPWPPTLPLQH